MELIVLGQVPGTSIQLTFSQISLICVGVFMALFMTYEAYRKQKSAAKNQHDLNDRSV